MGLFERSIDGIYKSTLDGKYIDVNPAFIKMLGYKNKKELMSIDIPAQLYVSKNDRPEIAERNRIFEVKLKKKDSSIIYTVISSTIVDKNKKPAYYEGIVRDITEQKKTEKQLKFLYFHDSLTGLYNRAYFEKELKQLDTHSKLPLSIIMANVNGLKIVNDTFGRKYGDLLLCECACIFEKCLKKEGIISRYGGDEFIILLSKTTEKETINIVNRAEEAFSKTDAADKLKIPISISMGISTKTAINKNVNTVIAEAEEQMHQRKFI
ncbi:MAG: sensor domain-containing diguanylate cyclase [Candidatus Humimicrobiaceae bacterium]